MNVSAMQVPLEKRCPGSVNINGMTHIRFNSDGTPSTADKTDGGCQPTSSNDAVAHKDVEAGLGNRGTPVKVPCRDKKKPFNPYKTPPKRHKVCDDPWGGITDNVIDIEFDRLTPIMAERLLSSRATEVAAKPAVAGDAVVRWIRSPFRDGRFDGTRLNSINSPGPGDNAYRVRMSESSRTMGDGKSVPVVLFRGEAEGAPVREV